MNKYTWMWVGVVLSHCCIPLALACGPWLPQAYVLRNDEVFYAPPEVGFAAELRHVLPEAVAHQALPDRTEAGWKELQQALEKELAGLDLPKAKAQEAFDAHQRIRSRLDEVRAYIGDRERKREALEGLAAPTLLPSEFFLYLQGALHFHRGEEGLARAQWKALLELPEDQRRHHSVTAAYMLARTSKSDVVQGYQRVRELARNGFLDPMGLAAASYGWQARHDLETGDYQKSIEGYLVQWAAGYQNALQSLQIVAETVFQQASDDELISLMERPQVRAVLTAYVLNQPMSHEADSNRSRLLGAVGQMENPALEEAGRFALTAYQHNQLLAARKWLKAADPSDALALWIRGKLLLREGNLEEGKILIETLAKALERQEQDWRRLDPTRAWGELGLLYLREGRFSEAATAFYNAKSWRDCAYVLERVMTMDEAVEWTKSLERKTGNSFNHRTGDPHALVARRLMREGRFEEAMKFFDPDKAALAQRYIDSRHKAGNIEAKDQDRARWYWAAARVMRDHGLSLFGSELYPDYAWYGGYFNFGDVAEVRKDQRTLESHYINRATKKELEQSHASRIKPTQRFHYRYRAAQLAELAAGLLPNNDPDAARIYWIAGGWIKYRDPDEADRFFKHLAVRCPRTELGQAARKINWFPNPDTPVPEPFSQGNTVRTSE